MTAQGFIRVTHTGVFASTLYIKDLDGEANRGSNRKKVPNYLGVGVTKEFLLTSRVQASIEQGDLKTFEDLGYVIIHRPGQPRNWAFQSNSPVQYVGGFYQFSGDDDDFAPLISWGDANYGKAAHFLLITGAPTVDTLTIHIIGTSITDFGVQVGTDTEDIVIPAGTPANRCIESSKKWNGEITVEAVSGTPVACNYGWAKYHDFENQDFRVTELECLWESDSTDSTSNIILVHHRASGWTFNAGDNPTLPTGIASWGVDHVGNTTLAVGPGAWKRTNLDTFVAGSEGEGIMFCVHSGSLGIGTVSFRILTCEVSLLLV